MIILHVDGNIDTVDVPTEQLPKPKLVAEIKKYFPNGWSIAGFCRYQGKIMKILYSQENFPIENPQATQICRKIMYGVVILTDKL